MVRRRSIAPARAPTTTSLSFKQWGTVFPGTACVVALVDRFAQHCHVVDIDAAPWPQKHAVTH